MQPMEFYESMAKAIKDRDHATAMVNKWNEKRIEAEAKVEELIKAQEVPVTEA